MHRFSRMMNPVILHNGTVTDDGPVASDLARALAIAGDRVVGGVGTHETALPSPERVDLGGRCVLPGFTDAHVHFPTWALARRQLRLEGCRSLAEASPTGCAEAAGPARGRWLVGYGWRSGDWAAPAEPTSHDLDPLTGDMPVALWAKDDHSLWLNSAATGPRERRSRGRGRRRRARRARRADGLLREESAWRFREPHIAVSEDEYVDAVRAGIRSPTHAA